MLVYILIWTSNLGTNALRKSDLNQDTISRLSDKSV